MQIPRIPEVLTEEYIRIRVFLSLQCMLTVALLEAKYFWGFINYNYAIIDLKYLLN